MEVYKATQPLKDETTGKYFYPQICVDQIYPVGSIYMSVNSTNPASLFGGTWERIKDTFLLSAGDTYSAGATGGEAEHTLTVNEMPSHNHINSAFNKNNEGSTAGYYPAGYFEHGVVIWSDDSFMTAGGSTGDPIGITRNTGGSQPHNNMPPYLAVYIWKRTA